MQPRVDPAVFWFLCTFASIGIGCWWTVRVIPDSGDRVMAFFGMLIIAAVAAQWGMGVRNDHR